MDAQISVMIDVISGLKDELDIASEKAESSEEFYRWWQEADREKDNLQKKNDALLEENKILRERVEELEQQLEELSQAKTAAVMLTDSNAKGVL